MERFSDLLKDKYLLDLMFVACMISHLCETYLTWDASYQLFTIINLNQFFPIENRPIVYLMQLPVVMALKINSGMDLFIYKKLYGLTYAFFPFFITLIGHIIHRENRLRFHFTVLGITLSSFLYMYIPLSEHLIACQVYILILSMSGERRLRYFEWGLLIILTLIHPVSLPLLLLHAFLNFLTNKKNYFSWGLPLIIAIVRIYLFFITKSETSHFEVENLYYMLGLHVKSFYVSRDFIGFIIIFIGSTYVFISFKMYRVAYLMSFMSLLLFIYWYIEDGSSIDMMLSMRHLIFLFFIMAAFLIYKINNSTNIKLLRNAQLSALIYLSVSLIYGIGYQNYLKELSSNIEKAWPSCQIKENISLPKSSRSYWHWSTLFEYYMYKGSSNLEYIVVPNTCNKSDSGFYKVQEFISTDVFTKGNYFKLNF